jgi:hypothetical protein
MFICARSGIPQIVMRIAARLLVEHSIRPPFGIAEHR